MDKIKEAFQKVKIDIEFLKNEIASLKKNLLELTEKIPLDIEKKDKEFVEGIETNQQKNQAYAEEFPTDKYHFKPLKPQNLGISTGNQGVPTDKQTDKQTDRHIKNRPEKSQNSFDGALEILNSLDSLKKEIRLKFKRLTNQEFLIFSTIYQLDNELGYSNYRLLSQKLNLSESAIRDYVGRIIKKGISIEKIKINNKNVQLSISEKLKKIASLATILQLREI